MADFTQKHPGQNVDPKLLNGSSVETLFNQLKHCTSGNLTVSNYETTKATLLMKLKTAEKEDYRSDKLYLRQTELLKKKS